MSIDGRSWGTLPTCRSPDLPLSGKIFPSLKPFSSRSGIDNEVASRLPLEVALMPPRGFLVAIVVFWIGPSCLLVERAILPLWQAASAPAFASELTDEVGSPQVSWDVYRKDEKIGGGITHIRRQPDRAFEMSQLFHFEDFKVLVLNVKRLDTVY